MTSNHPILGPLLEEHADRIKAALFDEPIQPGDFEIACVRFAGDPQTWTSETSACVTVRVARVLHQLNLVHEYVAGRRKRSSSK